MIPLSECSAETQEEVRLALLRDTPPPKWKLFGDANDSRPTGGIISRAWYEWNLTRGRDMRRRTRRAALPPALRLAVIKRDGLNCGLCGCPIVSVQDVDVDHIIPVSRGGSSNAENLQVTHSSCNRRKGNRV